MDPRSPLARAQTNRLTELRQLGVCTDESLVAHFRALEQPYSRSMLSRIRSGERVAPLGLLDLLLGHATPAERIAILDLWARPWGLCVVPLGDHPSGARSILDLALDLVSLVGALLALVRRPSTEARWEIRQAAAEIRRTAGTLENASASELRRAA